MISEKNRRNFESLGPTDLRRRLAGNIYCGQDQIEADEWLDELAHGPDRAMMREQIEIARESKEAARAAVLTSRLAVLIALGAIIVPHIWK